MDIMWAQTLRSQRLIFSRDIIFFSPFLKAKYQNKQESQNFAFPHISSSFLFIIFYRVPWESIQNMASLHTLNLDHNLIDHIAEGVFGELYKLARLDMTSNRLRTLPPDPFFARLAPKHFVFFVNKTMPLLDATARKPLCGFEDEMVWHIKHNRYCIRILFHF